MHHSSSTFFEFSSSLVLEYGRLPRLNERYSISKALLKFCITKHLYKECSHNFIQKELQSELSNHWAFYETDTDQKADDDVGFNASILNNRYYICSDACVI